MSSTNERVNIYLPPVLADVIKRTADVREVSRARVIIDLLESIAPQLEQMVTMLEMAKRAPAQVADQLKKALEAATDQLEPIAAQSGEAFTALQLNIEDAIEQAVERTKTEAHRDAA